MAAPLCKNCIKCKSISEAGSDCSAADMVVTPVFRRDVEDGRYENCPWRNRRASSSELKLINLLVRLYERWDEDNGRRVELKKLTRAEIKEIEAQVRKRSASRYVPETRQKIAA